MADGWASRLAVAAIVGGIAFGAGMLVELGATVKFLDEHFREVVQSELESAGLITKLDAATEADGLAGPCTGLLSGGYVDCVVKSPRDIDTVLTFLGLADSPVPSPSDVASQAPCVFSPTDWLVRCHLKGPEEKQAVRRFLTGDNPTPAPLSPPGTAGPQGTGLMPGSGATAGAPGRL